MLDGKTGAGVADGGLDLGALAHDAGVAQQAPDIRLREARHPLGVEAGEGPAVAVALPEDRQPTESGVRVFQDEELEEPAIIVLRDAPLLVVVLDVKRVARLIGSLPY